MLSFRGNGICKRLPRCPCGHVGHLSFPTGEIGEVCSKGFADAPAHLKKELDTVLTLQGDLDTVEKAIHTAQVTLSTSSVPSKSSKILNGLEEMHEELSNKVEELYVSLNVQESYPDLQGFGIDFVRTLLMAHDLKVNIRKRAIGSFFEWDRLDQAVGGRSNPLGTVLSF